MAICIRRREFIAALGGAAMAWPLTADAQPRITPMVGYLSGGAPGPFTAFLAAFRQGLGQTGYVEGQNVAIEYRWAEGHYDRLPALAVDLVDRKADLIVEREAQVAARALGQQILVVNASSERDFDMAFATLAHISRPIQAGGRRFQ